MIDARPLPQPTPESAHFWEGTRLGELRLQRCRSCSTVYFPPQPFCPRCSTAEVEIITACGRGRLHSFVISHLPAPGFAPPFVIAIVELDEGPRLLTNLVDIEPDPTRIALDLPVEVVFETVGDVALALFRPRREP